MYKKGIGSLLAINLLFLLGVFFVKGYNYISSGEYNDIRPAEQSAESNDVYEKMQMLGIANVKASGQRVVETKQLDKKEKYNISEEEKNILLRIVEAEAGGEDAQGKLLVANVVLNRVNSNLFPDTVTEVVFQKNGKVTQFSPVANGRYYRVTISSDTVNAVERALEGEDISQGALFFAAREYADSDKMKWFDEELSFLFCHGGHEFFK